MEVYWEPQKAAFCGVHAVNNLIQGPLYSEWDFSQVALALTEEERKLMAAQGTDSKDYLVFMAKDSTHVDESGNFSIEVIKKAITNMNLEITSLNHPKMKKAKQEPHKEIAFICNHASHWLTIRKIAGVWYNLNSLLNNGPHTIGETYLGAFLQQLALDKYSIFVIRGRLPDPLQEKGNGMRIAVSKISTKGTKGIDMGFKGEGKGKGNGGGTGAAKSDLERALALSRQDQGSHVLEDDMLKRALEMSMATTQSSSSSSATSAPISEEEQLRLAMQLSMQDN
mmetsp:Transcript_8901/g.12343  ORF Transcript_8901/g.12343 Transcript_8901/m.12343 type:complete len:282 (-) Transcript_8901:258-1103(-)